MSDRLRADRSHALRGNASRDAPRSSLTSYPNPGTVVTQSVTGCIPTQSVGTISTQQKQQSPHEAGFVLYRSEPRSETLPYPYGSEQPSGSSAVFPAPPPALRAWLPVCVALRQSVAGL